MYLLLWYKIKRFISDQWTLFLSIGVVIFLFLAVLIFYVQFNKQLKEVRLLEEEVTMLGDRFNTLKYNKALTQDQIKEYNKLLASLIPETEDFFSIIYALEGISNKSGFKITNYTIEVGESSKEKLTLSVQGIGDPDDFLKFLQEYQYIGGRLATSDKIVYRGTSANNTVIVLNFYSKRFSFNETVRVPQLTKKEIERLNEIKNKVQFQFSGAGFQSIDTEYQTKKNPFLN